MSNKATTKSPQNIVSGGGGSWPTSSKCMTQAESPMHEFFSQSRSAALPSVSRQRRKSFFVALFTLKPSGNKEEEKSETVSCEKDCPTKGCPRGCRRRYGH